MKHFIFDMGGVIVKPMKIEEIYNSFEWTISWEQFLYKFISSKKAILIHRGQITIKDYFNYIKQYIKKEVSYDEFMKSYIKSKQSPYEDTIEIISRLKKLGHKVYILSNLREIDFECYQKKFDTSMFDDTFLSYELNMLKPDKEIYMYALERIKSASNGVYFFDDIEENVNAAKALGINSYQVTGETIKNLFNGKIFSILEKENSPKTM